VELTAVASRTVQDGPPMAHVAPPETATPAVSEGVELQASDSSAEMAVKIAKEFQARALEDFKTSMNAALDCARGLVETRAPAVGGSKGDQIAKPDEAIVTGLGAAAQYRAESLELVQANVKNAVDYARNLAHARTSAEFVELSSELARKQCELALKQAAALKSFTRAVAKSDPR
jgi:hypothetical protein